MTTDTTALQERIARALHGRIIGLPRAWERLDPEFQQEYLDDAAAVLPIIAAEAQAAKAEAWTEYAAALEAVPDHAPTAYDKGRVDQRHATIEELHARAARRDEAPR